MKLCRFELVAGPPGIRTGIFADRVYETQGLSGVGIHEPSKVRILAPTGQLTSIRLPGEDLFLLSPTDMMGPLGELDFPASQGDFGVEVRPAAVLKDKGDRISLEEAPQFVLGYTILVNFVATESAGSSPCWARDFPVAVGPFITTPEELEARVLGNADHLQFRFSSVLSVNGSQQEALDEVESIRFSDSIIRGSRDRTIGPSDLLAGEPMRFAALPLLPLGRWLRPGDSVQASIEPLGTLVVRIV